MKKTKKSVRWSDAQVKEYERSPNPLWKKSLSPRADDKHELKIKIASFVHHIRDDVLADTLHVMHGLMTRTKVDHKVLEQMLMGSILFAVAQALDDEHYAIEHMTHKKMDMEALKKVVFEAIHQQTLHNTIANTNENSRQHGAYLKRIARHLMHSIGDVIEMEILRQTVPE